MYKNGIRTTEFFKDHDKLRSGIITESQVHPGVCGALIYSQIHHIHTYNTNPCVHIHTYMYTYTHTHIHVRIINTYMYTHACMHTTQFTCGLALCCGQAIHLSREEVGYVVEHFRTPDGRIRFNQFCQFMENGEQ